MRIMVTGGSGRLGRSVVRVLTERGHRVVSVDPAPGPNIPDVQHCSADLLDDRERASVFAYARPDAVVHLAGVAVPFARPDTETLSVNTRLAWAVLSAAVAHGARSATAASSPTVFGYGAPDWRPRYFPLDEAHPIAPWHSYGLSKAAIEETVRTLDRAGSRGCALTCVRPGYVITPEEWAGAPTQQGHTVTERLDRPELAAASLFNYIDARDAAELFALIAEHPERAGHGRVFHAIATDALARAPLAELLPRFHPGTERHAGTLTGTRSAFSSSAAERALGWHPHRFWAAETAGPGGTRRPDPAD